MEQVRPYYVFPSFEAIVDYLKESPGSYYERDRGLARRCVYGRLWAPHFGTVTYVTDDGRIGLLWAFEKRGIGWIFIYPDEGTINYFLYKAPYQIRAVLENNMRGDIMSEKINWPDFESKFYRLDPGNQSKVKLTNWRQRERTFGESETPRTTLVFDVIAADGKKFSPPKEWGTTSPALAAEFRPLIEDAEAIGREELFVILKRTTDKKYIVIDISGSTEEKVVMGLKQ